MLDEGSALGDLLVYVWSTPEYTVHIQAHLQSYVKLKLILKTTEKMMMVIGKLDKKSVRVEMRAE